MLIDFLSLGIARSGDDLVLPRKCIACSLFLLVLHASAMIGSHRCFAQTRTEVPIPKLEKKGPVTQLMVDGKPWLILGGELHNSSASSAEYMLPVWKKLTDMNLNTVIGTVSWELIEPEEGRFDFTTVDQEISEARKHDLKLVLIWFGTWKSTAGSYTPLWVKTNPQRFPPVETSSGQQKMPFGVNFEGISVFGANIVSSDAKAFRALMRHIRDSDSDHTVLMMQVDNETGMFGDDRDRSQPAQRAWSEAVPQSLLRYMQTHKTELTPALSKAWSSQGFKTDGTWQQVFGAEPASGEIFMAWHMARAIQTITEAGKAELPLPMFTNSWLGPVANMLEPGQYPSGGPVAGMLDVWRAAAPNVDFFAPNAYSPDFQGICAQYNRPGNPLFIPETFVSVPNLFWAIGHHSALGYSPFGIDGVADPALGSAYGVLRALSPSVLSYQPQGKVMAVVQGNDASVREFEEATGLSLKFGDVRSAMAPPGANDAKKVDAPPQQAPAFGVTPKDVRGFALVVQTGPSEFLIAGSGLVVLSSRSRFATIDEVIIKDAQQVPGRRLNGDETFSGNLFELRGDSIEVRKVRTYVIPAMK
jgi:Domain of unknown function (DUF5597)/Beta-galactosidase